MASHSSGALGSRGGVGAAHAHGDLRLIRPYGVGFPFGYAIGRFAWNPYGSQRLALFRLSPCGICGVRRAASPSFYIPEVTVHIEAEAGPEANCGRGGFAIDRIAVAPRSVPSAPRRATSQRTRWGSPFSACREARVNRLLSFAARAGVCPMLGVPSDSRWPVDEFPVSTESVAAPHGKMA